MYEMSPLSEITVNQPRRGRTPGPKYLDNEDAKPTTHPPKDEDAVMAQPTSRDLSSTGIPNRQRQGGQRHPPLPYRSRPRPVRPQLKPSLSKVGLASNKRHNLEGSKNGIKPRSHNSSIPHSMTGAGPLNHYRSPPFQRLGHNMASDYAATKYSPFQVSSRRLDWPSIPGSAYTGKTTHGGPWIPNHQPVVDWQEDIPTCKWLDDENQSIEHAFRYYYHSPSVILSSDGDAPNPQASETFQKFSRIIPSVCSDTDTIRLSPNQFVSRRRSPTPAIQTSVSYYDYSEPFHEVATTPSFKSPVTYAGPSIVNQRAWHASKPGGNQVAPNWQNNISRQIRFPSKSQSARVVGDTKWNHSNLQRGDAASLSHVERGVGSSLPNAPSQRKHYVSQSYRSQSNLDTQSSAERRLSMASLRLGFSFPIHTTNSTNTSDGTHGLRHDASSGCSILSPASLPSIPIRLSDKLGTGNASTQRTCRDQTRELLDGLARQSQPTENQLYTDSQAAVVANFQNTERPISTDSHDNALASVLNSNDFSRPVLESEPETELRVGGLSDKDNKGLVSVLDDSLGQTSQQTRMRNLPKTPFRYQEKGTQTSRNILLNEAAIEVVKGTNGTSEASSQKDCGKDYSDGQPNKLGGNCEVTARLLTVEAEMERIPHLEDSSFPRKYPELSSDLQQITGKDACHFHKKVSLSTVPQTPDDIDSTYKQTATRLLQLTPTIPRGVMEQDQGPGPSIREPSPESPHSNHNTGEAFIRPKKFPKSQRSDQPKNPNTKFGLSGHFSWMRDKSITDATRPSQLDPISHKHGVGTERRLKLYNRARYSRPEHSIQDDSCEFPSGNESRRSDPSSPIPNGDSIDTPGGRSLFSDDSSFKPRKRLRRLIISLAARLANPIASLKWSTHYSQRSSRRSSESTGGENDVTKRSSSINNTGASKPQSIKRKSISKAKNLWRRCSLH